MISPSGRSVAPPVPCEAAGWLGTALTGEAGREVLKGGAVSRSRGVAPGTDDLHLQPFGFTNAASGEDAAGGCSGIWHCPSSPQCLLG